VTPDAIRSLVRVASWIVPKRLRSAWRQEWIAELDYSWRIAGHAPGLRTRCRIAGRAASALIHALWLRQEDITMDQILQDTRHAVRRLARSPGFFAAVVLTLAVVIGANAAIFTLLDRVVLAPLLWPHADRLVALDHSAPGIGVPGSFGMSHGLAREYAALDEVEAIARYMSAGLDVTIAAGGEPERVASMRVSPSFADVFGFRPAAGRWFTDADSRFHATQFAILTPGLAERLYGDASSALGRLVRLDGMPYEVVGIAPRGFTLPDERVQVLVPFYPPRAGRAGPFGIQAVARLRPGVTPQAMRARMADVIATLPERFPGDPSARELTGTARLAPAVEPLKARLLGAVGGTLWMLMGAVLLVLLIACANLANLFLIRADARRGEWAVRSALGAGRARVAAGFVWEAVIVSIVGGVAGVMLAAFVVQWLAASVPFDLPRAGNVQLDAAVVALAMLLSLAIGVTLGVIPLTRFHAAPVARLLDVLRGSSEGREDIRWRHALVIVQVSLTVVLLTSAGLLGRSFVRLIGVDPGIATDGRLTFGVAVPRGGSPGRDTAAFHDAFLDRVRALPGVRRAAAATSLPLQGGSMRPLEVRGRDVGSEDSRASVRWTSISSDYLETLGIPLLRGRHLSADEIRQGRGALINEALARAYFPGEDPLGREIRGYDFIGEWSTIVGIVGHTVANSLEEGAPTPQLLMPLRGPSAQSLLTTSYVVWSDADPLGHVASLRQIRDELDPEVAIMQPELLGAIVRRSGARMAFSALLLGVTAIAGVLLGALGVYAIVGYGVALRAREIAIRMALGADRHNVSWMIVRQGGLAIGAGVLLGLWGAFFTGRALEAQLFGVAWYDPLTYLAVTATLATLGMFASWLPAFRAASVSPLRLLR
jgi:predicted permease